MDETGNRKIQLESSRPPSAKFVRHRRKSVTKRPGVDRDWRHAVEMDINDNVEEREKEEEKENIKAKEATSPRQPPVDQTLYFEEKISPILDEISRAVSCGK